MLSQCPSSRTRLSVKIERGSRNQVERGGVKMLLDEFEEEKLLERFRPILDRECSLADCFEYSDGIAEDIFSDIIYYHPEKKTAAEFTDEQLRGYARERIARDLANEQDS
jgi:hypothetical protein